MSPKLKISDRRVSKAKKTAKYWTKSKMAKATPIPLRVAPKELLESMCQEAKGKSRVVPPVLPARAQRLAAQTVEVPDIEKFPFSCVGKLFMREGNNNFVGSAWVIGERTIFSAAHCLFDDNGTFFDDVLFFPQYSDGSSAGRFSVVQMAVDSRYADSGGEKLEFDLGIAILDRPIAELTGVAGYAVKPVSQIALGESVTGVGYPAGAPFNGERMFQSNGDIVRDGAPGTHEERFFGAENDMTGGSSGGPWFDASGTVVGLNSFVFVGEDPQVMHSPYFGEGFEVLLEWAHGDEGEEGEEDGHGRERSRAVRLLPADEKEGRKLTNIGSFSSLKQCLSVEVQSNEVCLKIPFIPDLCVELPISVPDGELVEACVELQLPNCIRITVEVFDEIVVDETFCL